MTTPTVPPGLPLRPATTDELAVVATVAERLDRASDRGVDETVVPHAAPPGRLDLGQAMQADAQRMLRLPRTATPWQRRQHRVVRAPALRLGIAIDHSPSMSESLDDAMAAAWTLSAAANTARQARSTVAIATFDIDAHLVAADSATHVPMLATAAPGAANHSAGLPDALELLRHRLELDLHPDDSRLLVVVSDSALTNPESVERSLTGLADSGTRILWVSIDEDTPDYLPAGITAVGVSSAALLRTLPDTVTDALAAHTPGGYQ